MTAPRVRFSPAPTGQLHVGSARSCLFNWLFARHTGGALILRIEDTDIGRSDEGHVRQIIDTFAWLGIDFDEGPYRQSERRDRHQAAIDQIVDAGLAYWCDLTPEQVQERARQSGRPGYDGYSRDRGLGPGPGRVLRFRTPDEGTTSFDDVVRGRVSFENANLEDFVIQRADGSPLFLVANAVDDIDMGITHVIRGEDLVNTTPKVLLLREALGSGAPPVYAHIPLIVNEQRKKLSKRRDDVAVEDYRHRGYLPEAMLNYLALLGWGPEDGIEIRPIAEIIDLFRLEDVSRAPAAFDPQKLLHFNGEYIRALPVDEFIRRCGPELDSTDLWPPERFSVEKFTRMAPMVQERVRTLSEVPEMVDFLFLDSPRMDEKSWAKAMAAPEAVGILEEAIDAFGDLAWDADRLHVTLSEIGERRGLKLGKAQAPIRVAVTGRSVGPPLFESMEVLGQDETLERLRSARARL